MDYKICLAKNNKLLIVDDDKDTVRLFSELLEAKGFKVVGQAYSGKEAIDAFVQTKPDVILLDIMMPDGTGIYAIRKIKEIKPSAKIIAVTADSRTLTEDKLAQLKVPIVYKPFDIKKVIEMINEI